MKKRPTEAQLAKRFQWWWREPSKEFVLLPNGQTRKPDEGQASFWKDGIEDAAFKYELTRRHCREKKLPPWPELDHETHVRLWKTLGQSDEYWVVMFADKRAKDHTEPVQFNLRATDSALLRAFERHIREQRVLWNIPAGAPPRKNSPSWHWLEIWDEHERADLPAYNVARGLKAKAKARAEKVAPAVLSCLKPVQKV